MKEVVSPSFNKLLLEVVIDPREVGVADEILVMREGGVAGQVKASERGDAGAGPPRHFFSVPFYGEAGGVGGLQLQ